MSKIDVSRVPSRKGSEYPAPFAAAVGTRVKQALGNAGGLVDFGVNLTQLPAGGWSSQRHWHTDEDEFVYVLSGELVLITEAGEQTLVAHDCAAFPKHRADGHHLVNRGNEMAVYLEIGTRSENDRCHYPDIDLRWDSATGVYTHKDGSTYS